MKALSQHKHIIYLVDKRRQGISMKVMAAKTIMQSKLLMWFVVVLVLVQSIFFLMVSLYSFSTYG